ncbi:hypothetical protein [Apilactobacillus micheneri]|uniref:Uncharacterized protein n=1 Tax=Apilactobacillus micheneri TaxID=1899430 RepID=A0A9Q8MUB4_9LACO|nr:hypothetical protein [Apilactobacillus micheneri]TPR40012.1 hypothetical protein DY121_04025 [Apilactobacillus micheneri]TPR41823.1 hypothetical protein DY123_04645 [Apilactobacillus micheneri]TPR44214.1 hypothetical protein DY130_04020 [Apilactobacillus micheneri]TPR45838.1 hypothetical protein DY128_04020 [Apilactobacillus micheneri]TPR50582.1 hypothetical protein DY037_01135 [Apilactobacillus micheneri]
MKNYLKKAFSAKELTTTIGVTFSAILLIWFSKNVDEIMKYNIIKITEFIVILIFINIIGLFKVKYLDKLNNKNYYVIFNLFLFIFEVLFAIYII